MPPSFTSSGSIAAIFGAKALVYGPPGAGKTPLAVTAPRPVLCLSEPGALSLKGTNVPACEAMTPAAIDDFYRWFESSKEAANYDTVCVDSVSEQASIYLRAALANPKYKDPRQAYGEMFDKMMAHLNLLFYTRGKHVYLTAKQASYQEGTVFKRQPYFAGQAISTEVKHLYDLILHLDTVNIPGVGATKALRCRGSLDILARNRGDKLAEFEPSDLTHIFNKVTQG